MKLTADRIAGSCREEVKAFVDPLAAPYRSFTTCRNIDRTHNVDLISSALAHGTACDSVKYNCPGDH
jgi:hypothetical protein